MKLAGSIAIAVAAILFIVSLGTIYSYQLDVSDSTVREHMDNPPSIPWGAQAGGEGILGFAFLIAGIALVTRKNS